MVYPEYTEKDIYVDVGFCDAAGSYSCAVKENGLLSGAIYIKNPCKNTQVGELHVITTDGNGKVCPFIRVEGVYAYTDVFGYHVVRCNPYLNTKLVSGEYTFYIYFNGQTLRILDGEGNVVASSDRCRGSLQNKEMWINEIGVSSAQHSIGSYGVDDIYLYIYEEYYNSAKSEIPNKVDVKFNWYALPCVYTNLKAYLSVLNPLNNKLKDKVESFIHLDPLSSGYNYVSDLELNAKLVLDSNDLHDLTELFDSATLSFRLGGYDYLTVDLLENPSGYVSPSECLPAGKFTDAAYHIVLEPKAALENKNYTVSAHLRFWFTRSYPACD